MYSEKNFNMLKFIAIVLIIAWVSTSVAYGSGQINKKNEFAPGDALELTFIDIYKKAERKCPRRIDIGRLMQEATTELA